MPYIGRNHVAGDHTSNFKVLDDISSYTATFNGSLATIISTADNTVRIPEHRFIQGQRVTYSNGGGGNIGGLTNGTAYFVTFDTANTIKLATSLANANNNTNVNLSSVGSGSSHTLTAAFDGTNTKFKLTHNGGESSRLNNATQLQVAINNVLQRPNIDPNNFTEGFAVERGNKIVFQTAPTSNDVFWGSIIANTLETFDISDNKVENFTGDGSTTEFNLSRIPPNNGSIVVTINGVLQHSSDTTTARAYSLSSQLLIFTSAPANGDEIQVRHIGFAGASTGQVSGFYGRTGNVVLGASDHITTGDITARNINSSGIVTASTFDGAFTGNVVGTSATFTGNLTVGGVLTYEDVTNIDSVGIITAAKDIHVGAGISAVGVITGRYLNPSSVSTQNVIIGWEQSTRNVTGNWNVLLGRRAGEGLTSGGSAVCIGANAGQLLGSSSGIFIGGQAGARVTGGNNLFIGGNAGAYTTSAGACTIIGHLAGIDNQGSNNTIVGFYAGRGNSGVTDGAQNTFIGGSSGFKIEGGDDNTGLGFNSLRELLGGNKNVAIGRNAGNALVSGNNNIIIGYDADASTSTTSNEITLGDANINHLRIPGIGVSFNNTGGTQLGIITATELDISSDLDVDGHTNLDNVSIAGVSTFTGASSFNSDTTTVKLKVNSTNAQIDLTSGQASFTRFGAINHYHNNSTSTIHNQIKLAPRNGGTGRIMFYNLTGGSLTERLRIDGTDGIQAIAHITPMSDNLYALGGTSTRWSSVTTKSLFLIDTDEGSSAGPEFKLYRNSASPADADYLGQIKFAGESETGVERNYAKITGKILDASNGTEDGIIEFAHIKGGSQTITGRWRSDSLQLLNGTNFSVAGTAEVTGTATFTGNILPSSDSATDIGTNSVRFANLYADTLYGNGANLTGIDTDLVSDTSPQLGGTLDGNGQTANFTANNTGLGIPIGTDANEPSASSYKGYIRYNDDDDVIYYSNGTVWQKISAKIATLTSISGDIYVGTTTNLTLTGTGFLSSNLVVNFVQSSDSINANVTVTPSSDTAATVAVPAAVYNNVTAGNAVTIKVTNSDGSTSGTVNKTAIALPSGGSVYTSGGYRYHKFTSSGTFTQTLSRTVEYLIVAGGGAGGGSNSGSNRLGGGGGAGGLRGGSVSTTPQGYTITIGAGGSGVGAQVSKRGNSGSNSSAFGVTSTGGGGGGSGDASGSSSANGGNGGSGGGGGRTGNAGSGTSGQGNNGGSGASTTNPRVQGGGGGAGAAGNNGSNNGSNGNGYGGAGSNAYSTWASATSSGDGGYYAGGGGGGWHGSYTPVTRALGGAGGGGNGGDSTGDNSNAYGKTGDANTGGGGGGNSTTSPHNGVSGAPSGPAGGSGIVIIRYQL